MRLWMRCVRTKVFPLPGPAMTSQGPFTWRIASDWEESPRTGPLFEGLAAAICIALFCRIFSCCFLEFFDSGADAGERFFLAEDLHDLGCTCRSRLLAGDRSADRPENIPVLYALLPYVVLQGRKQRIIAEISLLFEQRKHLLQYFQRCFGIRLHLLVRIHGDVIIRKCLEEIHHFRNVRDNFDPGLDHGCNLAQVLSLCEAGLKNGDFPMRW